MAYVPIKTPAEALRRFEEFLIPEQLVAAQDESFALYAQDELPRDIDAKFEQLIQQGYEAGYARAMAKVRKMLFVTQSEVNRG